MTENALDAQVPINLQTAADKNRETLKIKCSNCHGNHVASSRECQKFKDQIKIQADKAKVRQEKLQNNLVVRGVVGWGTPYT